MSQAVFLLIYSYENICEKKILFAQHCSLWEHESILAFVVPANRDATTERFCIGFVTACRLQCVEGVKQNSVNTLLH